MSPKRMNTALIGLLVFLMLGTIAGIYFANQRLTALAKETSKISADIEVTKEQIDSYTLTKIKIESLDYVGELAEKVLPESQEQSVVVAELSQFANRSRLTVSGIEFIEKTSSRGNKKSVVPKGVEVVPIIIKFKDANYENLLEFLKTVEGNRRKMHVNNVNLKPKETDRSVLSEVTVTLNLYVKKAASPEKKQ